MDGLQGLNISSIDESQFKTAEELERLIEHLNEVHKNMKHGHSVNGLETGGENEPANKLEDASGVFDEEDGLVEKFDKIEIIDLDTIPDIVESSWLGVYKSTMTKEERLAAVSKINCFDDNYFDTGLVNIRYQLLNMVKAAINEGRIAALTTTPAPLIQTLPSPTPPVAKHVVSGTSEGLSPTVPSQNTCTPLRRNLSYVIRRDSSTPPTPTTNNYSARTPTSSGGSPVLEVYSNGQMIASPSVNGCDMNSTVVLKSHSSQAKTTLPNERRPANLNTTITREYSPPKCAIYSGPSSPELNTTFTQRPSTSTTQDDMLSTSSNSNNSVYNISMEEVHTMARIQEQSLARKSTSTPHAVSRKDTHVLEFDANGDDLPVGSKQWPGGAYVRDDTASPPSNSSSGVSSPRENQSYETMQMAGPTVRRSMPNLALVKEIYSSPRKQSFTLGIHAAASTSATQLRKQPHYISDSKLARPQTRTLPRPTVFPVHYPRYVSQTQSSTESLQQKLPYSSNYGATFTRGKTFEKLPDNLGVDRRPYTVSVGPSYEERVRNSRKQSDGGGRSVPQYTGTFTRAKDPSLLNDTAHRMNDPALADPDSDMNPPDKLHIHTSAGAHNLIGSHNRPSQLPQSSRLRSRIPGPGRFSVAPNRATNYKE